MPAEPRVDPTLLRHYGAEGGRHAHAHAQVLFGWDGALELEVDGRAAWVDASCGLVVPAGTLHAYRAPRPARVLVLDCDSGPLTERVRRFALAPDWRRRTIDRDTLFAALGGAPTRGTRRRLDLAALVERIDAELAHDWTVHELAAACHLSPQRLRARFAELGSTTPLGLVRERRLAQAADRLAQGWTLEATALAVGYADASALSAALRREHATGARALRRERRALRTS